MSEDKRLNIAIVHVGAASAGLNAATRAVALYSLSRGHKLYAVQDGFAGLVKGDLKNLTWMDVEGWHSLGGSEIGTNRSLPSQNIGKVAFTKIQYPRVIDCCGFEAFTSLHELSEQKANYPIFEIPMVVVPATVSKQCSWY